MRIAGKIKLIMVIFCFAGFVSAKAQTLSTVKIKDLVLVPETEARQTNDAANLHVDLNFKISAASNASKVYMLLGSSNDSGTILNTQATIIHQGAIDKVVYNDQSNAVSKYTVRIPLQLVRSQLVSPTFLTVYIEDATGSFSNKLYYSFNP